MGSWYSRVALTQFNNPQMSSEAEAERWHLEQELLVLLFKPVAADSEGEAQVEAEEEETQAISQASLPKLDDTSGHLWLRRSSMALSTGMQAKMEKKEESSDEDTQVKMEKKEESADGAQAARQPLKRSRTLAFLEM